MHPMQSNIIKEKLNTIISDKYGCDNINKNEEFRKNNFSIAKNVNYLKYIGNNAGTILFVSQEFSDKNDLPKSQGVGAIWAIADLSIFKENNAWMKFHKLDGLYGRN